MNENYEDNIPIDDELQVRLMNLVMGEVSDFERDQLQLMMEQRSDVASYYQHIEHLHGLLQEAVLTQPAIDAETQNTQEVLQMSPDRRERVLAALSGKEEPLPAKVTLASSTIEKSSSRWAQWRAVGLIAAAASILIIVLPSSSFEFASKVGTKAREVASRVDVVAGKDATYFKNGEVPMYSDGRTFGRYLAVPGTSDAHYASDDFKSQSGMRGSLSDPSKASSLGENVIVQGLAGQVANTGKPIENEFGYGQVGDRIPAIGMLGPGTVESRLEEAKQTTAGVVASMPAPTAAEPIVVETNASVPDGGSILLGGIRRPRTMTSETPNLDRLFSSRVNDGSGTLSMNVTPRILIPEEEEELLGYVANEKSAETIPQLRAGERGFAGTSQSNAENAPGPTPDFEKWSDITRKRNARVDRPSGDFDSDQLAEQGQLNQAGKQLQTRPPIDLYANKGDAKDQPVAMAPLAKQVDGLKRELQEVAKPKAKKSELAEETVELGRAVVPKKEAAANGTIASIETEDRETFFDRRLRTESIPDAAAIGRGRFGIEEKAKAPMSSQAIDEQSAAAEAFSTFSLHVSDVSFKLAQTALSQGQWPEAAKVRIEEFVNALDYHDPLPSHSQRVACRVEQAIHPFLIQRNLLRVSMRTAATGRSQNTPLRLTLLLDNSGSMERPDRRQSVVRAFQSLASQLKPSDQVTLISFANTPRLLADKVAGNQGEALLKMIENLPSEGGTNIESALLLAKEKAMEQQLAGAQNRIVLLTDGAVNLGDANPNSLAKLVMQLRDSGIAFDAAGVAAQDLNDEVLEALTRQGDGRYYLLDSAEDASESFSAQIAGALRPSAQNVKVQVEFNPLRVGSYKLLGFEKHRLNKEDFRNDSVDAAELAAAEAGVAIYQFEVKPQGSGDVGSVSVRFRDLSSGEMVERRWPIPYESNAPRLEQAPASMQLASCAALFAAKLSGGPLADSVDLGQLRNVMSNLAEQCAQQPRVQQLKTMIEQAAQVGR